jgi:hypothetical protein
MVNDITVTSQETGQWITLQEASSVTGKSVNALNLMIRRRKINKTRKVNGKGQGKWLIHKDSLIKFLSPDPLSCQPDQLTRQDDLEDQSNQTGYERFTPMIPLEHYEKKRDEWESERDKLMQGLMMYRYKFEELEKQVKMLPAPVEVVSSEFERLKSELEGEKKKSWWKKLFG